MLDITKKAYKVQALFTYEINGQTAEEALGAVKMDILRLLQSGKDLEEIADVDTGIL